METSTKADLTPANLPKIEKELTFGVLKSRARRKLLVALASGGPQTGADLKHAGRGETRSTWPKHITNTTLTHLRKMVTAGIVLKVDHGTDGRRVLYSLSPLVKVTRYDADTEFDFGFIVARLNADGN